MHDDMLPPLGSCMRLQITKKACLYIRHGTCIGRELPAKVVISRRLHM